LAIHFHVSSSIFLNVDDLKTNESQFSSFGIDRDDRDNPQRLAEERAGENLT